MNEVGILMNLARKGYKVLFSWNRWSITSGLPIIMFIALACVVGALVGFSTAYFKVVSKLLPFLVAGVVPGAVLFWLLVKHFSKVLFGFLLLAPFYYFPLFFTDAIRASEGFFMRAGKDALIVILLFAWLMRASRIRMLASIVTFVLLIFIPYGFLRSVNPKLEEMFIGWRLFIEYTVFYFIAYDTFRTEKQVRKLILGMILCSAIVSLLGYYEYSRGGFYTVFTRKAGGQTRITSTLLHPNSLGWYLAFIGALILGMSSPFRNKRWQWGLIVVFGLNTGCLLLTGSRSALAGLLLTIVTFVLLTARRKTTVIMVLILVPIAFLSSYVISSVEEMPLRIFSVTGGGKTIAQDSSLRARLEDAEIFIAETFQSTSSAFFGYGFSDDVLFLTDIQYINYLYRSGLVGLVLLGVALLGVFWQQIQLIARKQRLALPLFLGCFVIVVFGFVGNVFRAFPLGVFFWSLTGIAARMSKRKRLIYE